MIVTIFEDKDSKSLYPLNQLRASFELRCGAFTNLERVLNCLDINDEIQLLVRSEIKEIIKERYPNTVVNPDSLSPGIWLNGQAIWTKENIQKIDSGRTFTHNGRILGMHISEPVSIIEVYSYIGKASSVSMEINLSGIFTEKSSYVSVNPSNTISPNEVV